MILGVLWYSIFREHRAKLLLLPFAVILWPTLRIPFAVGSEHIAKGEGKAKELLLSKSFGLANGDPEVAPFVPPLEKRGGKRLVFSLA